MGFVAVGAGHLLVANRMRRRTEYFRSHRLVAFQADLGLSTGDQYRILVNVNLVATGTGQIVALVNTAVPAAAGIVVVAIQTHLILHFDWGINVQTKIADRWTLLIATDTLRVFSSGAMTTFALGLCHWAARICDHRMLGCEYRHHWKFAILIVAA